MKSLRNPPRSIFVAIVLILKVLSTNCFQSSSTSFFTSRGALLTVRHSFTNKSPQLPCSESKYSYNRGVLETSLSYSRNKFNNDEKRNKTNRLRRNKGRKQRKKYYRLPKDSPAWNIDGSSTHTAEGYPSWISFWESQTGLRRSTCSYSGCNKLANVGGHVWLQGKGPHIAPICKGCNHVQNLYRVQCDDENFNPSIKKGTTVVRTKFTEDMRNAERRIATYDDDYDEYDEYNDYDDYDDYDEFDEYDWSEEAYLFKFVYTEIRFCNECGNGITDRPQTHTKCLDCFRKSKSTRESMNREESKKRKERECASCGNDITSRPRNHKLCPQCFAQRHHDHTDSSQFNAKRLCASCSTYISDRPMNHKVCPSCYRKEIGKNNSNLHGRKCKSCHCNISDRPQNHTLCLRCWKRNRSIPT